MPKFKIPRKSTNIDMTAMCDVSFLLLTFFMLATKFKPPEPVEVVTPSSISDTKVADNDVMTITVDKQGRVFFEIDKIPVKKELIEKIAEDQGLSLTDEQKRNFQLGSGVGVPFSQLGSYLNLPPSEQKNFKATGIPVDTSLTATNELFKWVAFARVVNQNARAVIKGDSDAAYPVVDKVIKTLANDKVQLYKFYVITSLKTVNGKEG